MKADAAFKQAWDTRSIDNFKVRFWPNMEGNDQRSRAHISRFPVDLFEAQNIDRWEIEKCRSLSLNLVTRKPMRRLEGGTEERGGDVVSLFVVARVFCIANT